MIWTALKRLIGAVGLSGLLAGLILTAIQQWQVANLIQQAEAYEDVASLAKMSATHTHPGPEETERIEPTHVHQEHGWQPTDGLERTSFTALANVIMAVGLGFLLAAPIIISGKEATWRSGLLWGSAGYAVFFLAPSLGLPPELPDTMAAPIVDRQLWWIFTVIMTAGGLALICFPFQKLVKAIGLTLLILPHLIGAPQPEIAGGTAPENLQHAFIMATAIANAAFWLILGSLTGFFYQKLG